MHIVAFLSKFLILTLNRSLSSKIGYSLARSKFSFNIALPPESRYNDFEVSSANVANNICFKHFFNIGKTRNFFSPFHAEEDSFFLVKKKTKFANDEKGLKEAQELGKSVPDLKYLNA